MIPVESAPWEPACARGTLDTDTIELWRAPVEPEERAGMAPELAGEERARAERMQNPHRQAQFIAGHTLLNSIRAAHGAPLHTSLSHSGEWVLAAAARTGPVGVDVELLRADRPLERLSLHFFAPQEHAWLMRFSTEEQVLSFYGLWTAKEALFKALGMPAGAAHFAALPLFAAADAAALPQRITVEGCRVGWFHAAPGYLGAYADPSGTSRTRFLLPA